MFNFRDLLKLIKIFRETPIVDDSFTYWRDKVDRLIIKLSRMPEIPKVVCLCGSTKFKENFKQAIFDETMRGRIVLSVGCFMHADGIPINEEQKKHLDELHLRKIDLCDEVLVLNVGGYIGKSTQNEIAYALATGKPIRYLEGV